ncbi:hypothetical protein IC582_024724 [Cucumis melo]|uniref:Uncharacterized protein n=3 Tax=Cucumis melo TaxID=3656 RepID=A0A5A7TGG1_CUCMM|nr:uncharacterized protein LOC103499622 isoform X1 [Cucumis melo]KAA0040751.1 uncharacterized protein E6C27_scaffold703G00150 [Cucumis melo var. makuwa]
MELQDFAPIFGEPTRVEWVNRGSLSLHQFLFHVYTPSPSQLRFLVTDFHSNTWESTKSAFQLEDMRDDIGIGGAFSEFVDYIVASMKFGDVRLCMEGQSGKDGAACVKLIAQKSKGMPVFSISLTKLIDSAASEAMATMSLGLFNSLKEKECSLVKEQEHSLQLATMISTEKEKNENIQTQLGQYRKKQKLQNMNASNSPDKSAVHNIGSTKTTNRVVPAHRRAKTRGALLQDSEDDNEQERSLQSTFEEKEKKEGLLNTDTLAIVDRLQKSPDKSVHDIGSTKITNHVVPTHRRARTRGALLQDNEDDDGR